MDYLKSRDTNQNLAFDIAVRAEVLKRFSGEMPDSYKKDLSADIEQARIELFGNILAERGEFKEHPGDYWNPPEWELISEGDTNEVLEEMVGEAADFYQTYEGEFEEAVSEIWV